MKIIFLDIDGVLINEVSAIGTKMSPVCGWLPDPNCVKALNRIVRETDAKICVSSTWRLSQSIDDLAGMLDEWNVEGEVIGKTPYLYANCLRGDEIKKWIDEYESEREKVTGMVILDDNFDMGDVMCYLCLTDAEAGLTEDDADYAIKVLNTGLAVDHSDKAMTADTAA